MHAPRTSACGVWQSWCPAGMHALRLAGLLPCRTWLVLQDACTTCTTRGALLPPLHADLLPAWPALPRPHVGGWVGKQAAACLARAATTRLCSHRVAVTTMHSEWLLGIIAPVAVAIARQGAHQNGRVQCKLCSAQRITHRVQLHDWAHDTATIWLT